MAAVPKESWENIVRFYQSLIDDYGWRQQRMLEFVTWIAATKYSELLFPSTSHAGLGLSTIDTYLERVKQPMVYVFFIEQRDCFVIHWQRGPGVEVRKESVDSPQAPEVFGRILEWLGVAE